MAGNVLIGLAILGVAGAVLVGGGSLVEMGRTYPTSDRYAAAEGTVLLGGALLALAAILFLSGWYLRQPRPEEVAEVPGNQGCGHLLPLAIYLGGSIGIGLLAGLGFALRFPAVKFLALLIYQPTFFVQILAGGFLGLRFGEGIASHIILLVANVAYFVALFYPVYSMVVMDRAVEVVRYGRMKIILILFGSVHLLIGLAFAAIVKA
jgi:hypothetical protein